MQKVSKPIAYRFKVVMFLNDSGWVNYQHKSASLL